MTSKQDLRHNLWGPGHNENVGSLVQKDSEFQDVTAEHETTCWALPSVVSCMTSRAQEASPTFISQARHTHFLLFILPVQMRK